MTCLGYCARIFLDLTLRYLTIIAKFNLRFTSMKRIINLLPVLALLVSCNLLDNSKISSTDVGGDTNLTMNTVGTSFNTYVTLGSTSFNANSSIVVTKNDNGVVSLKVRATIPTSNYASLIPANLKDASGKLNIDVKYKNTSEGILDYTNKDGKPFVIVNYSSSVGDKYVLTKSDGTTITRTVTGKSDVDDFPYGMMLIKTMTVEQDSRIPGIRKIEYKANHKFGLVQVKVFFEDGTSATCRLM